MVSDRLMAVRYEDQPTLLAIADSPDGRREACRSAALAECRSLGDLAVDEARERLERQIAVDVVLADLSAESDDTAALLCAIEAEAATGRFRAVVRHPLALVDFVQALAPSALPLCEASETETVALLAYAARRAPDRLHDGSRTRAPEILQQLSQEVARIAHMLAALSEDEGAAARLESAAEAGDESGITAADLRAVLRTRRLRASFFKNDLFADPAWDIMLDLMAARLEGRRVPVSSLCIAAAVPPTTALRWIKRLTDEGVVVRVADPQDGRRVYIALADDAARALADYFRAAQRVSPFPA
ncbi:MAG: MarR family transcriptional regulator [Allosphingosinicella sp.]|uniref:MarR family transcriptional regulator n=1 Tax=Allosphingosinicella sp. TaxID=2823234 RepID=UPI00393F8028